MTITEEKRMLKRKAKELLEANGIKAFQKDICLLEASTKIITGTVTYLMFEHKGVQYQWFNNHLTIYAEGE